MVAVAKEKHIDPEFGSRLRALREGAGLSQERLAALAALSANAIARLERAEREPGWGTVRRLAKILEVTPDAFLGREEANSELPKGHEKK